jgi:hypothetical protein
LNSSYETIAASQTDQVLGPVGGSGDYLDTLTIVVATAATSTVSIKDGGGSAISVMAANAAIGTYALRLAIRSRAGAWSVTTGAGASVIATGEFK